MQGGLLILFLRAMYVFEVVVVIVVVVAVFVDVTVDGCVSK